MKRKPQPPVPWFRLRCAACACLTAAVWIGAFQASQGDSKEGAAEPVLTSAPGSPAPPLPAVNPAKVRPAIIIDPGHGGKDPGKVAGSQFEKTWTLQLSLALADELRRRGLPVELTRSADTTLGLDERSALANQEDRAALVSIHFNSGQPEANGIEVYHAWPKCPPAMMRLDAAHHLPEGTTLRDDRGRLLAEALQAAACEATGARNRGVKNDPGLAVLNRTLCPAVLIECGFLTNAAECANIQSSEWRSKLAAGLADCLEHWLDATTEMAGYGITYEPVVPAPPPPAAAVISHLPACRQSVRRTLSASWHKR